jgi:hypothetical protein
VHAIHVGVGSVVGPPLAQNDIAATLVDVFTVEHPIQFVIEFELVLLPLSVEE